MINNNNNNIKTVKYIKSAETITITMQNEWINDTSYLSLAAFWITRIFVSFLFASLLLLCFYSNKLL